MRRFLRGLTPGSTDSRALGRRDRDDHTRFRLRKAGNGPAPTGRCRLRMIYRISDGSYRKERFPFATKEVCLRNFLQVFRPSADELLIIADNVGEATWRMVNQLHANVTRTTICHGAGSWRYGAFDVALAKFDPDDVVYFVEDDYLHVDGARDLLSEGIAIANYVALYDHPDKYASTSDGGPNPFVEHGGEVTRLVRTRGAHWKVTNSTTMTFATTVRILREDRDIWDRHTATRHPYDFQAFLDLRHKGRLLITPVPGFSTHCELAWASPGVDWEAVARAATPNPSAPMPQDR